MTTYPVQIIPPNSRIQLVDPKTGILTVTGLQFLQQIWTQIVDTNQIIPCTATHTNNQYNLTPFPSPPSFNLAAYADYSIYSFVAPFTSTGAVTAQVATLGIIKVFISNGATQANTGDIVINDLYLLIYNSNLDTAAGGFVAK